MPKFMQYIQYYFLISALVLVPGLLSLGVWGLEPSVDFSGGSVWELQLPEEGVDEAQAAVEASIAELEIGVSTISRNDARVMRVSMDHISQEQKEILTAILTDTGIDELRFETVGPSLGRELIIKTITGVVVAAVSILFYVGWTFKDRMYGVSAILAMLHDTFIVLGVFSMLGHFYGVEVDALFVTAVLTILSFSVHDTIVVYDRIRESIRKYPKDSFEDLVDRAVGETLVRSVNNSLTILFMLLALFLLGGESIRWFVFALFIGTLAGTYSSTFTAAPLLVIWHRRFGKVKKK